MNEVQYIKVDSAFPSKMDVIVELISDGWNIYDKTVCDNRYVIYILTKKSDPDLGKTGTPI